MELNVINEGVTAWHFLGPWTGYIIGIIITTAVVILNKKIQERLCVFMLFQLLQLCLCLVHLANLFLELTKLGANQSSAANKRSQAPQELLYR